MRFPTRGDPKVVDPIPRESSARRVLSTVPAASTTALLDEIEIVLGAPPLTKSMLVIVFPLRFRRAT
jgi:hypothetical protein